MFKDLGARMDKKSTRSGQSPKGIVDSKKVPDASNNGKPFPKVANRREVSLPKPEQPYKIRNGSQKHRYDKRPESRKTYHGCGTTISQLEEIEELGLGIPRARKQNVNHLLNFQCKPRDCASFMTYKDVRSTVPNTVRNLMATHKHKYNKEQFLQANCQFVVRATEDYSINMADPDILVDWKFVEQIRVLSPEGVNCPICLYPPVVGKITRCGHIYCWSCILHYLSLTDKNWHKCPICFESIHQKDLKSVRILGRKQYGVGDVITFKLMKRERGSTLLIPVSENIHKADKFLTVTEDIDTVIFSKLLLSTYEDILKIIEEEEIVLLDQLVEYKHCPELCFVEQAIDLLHERKNTLIQDIEKIGHVHEVRNSSCKTDDNLDNMTEHENTESSPVKKIVYASAFDDILAKDGIDEKNKDYAVNTGTTVPDGMISDIAVETRETSSPCEISGKDINRMISAEDLELPAISLSAPNKDFLFYQVIDGQQIYIHSLNARMLAATYGGLENAPHRISGVIIERESGSMTEELRKRLRYLDHLPITCQFDVVEIELKPPLVTPETLNLFKEKLDMRCKLRLKREKEERKLEKKAKDYEKSQYGRSSPPRRLRLDSRHHFPECGSDSPTDFSPRTQSPQSSSRTGSPHSSQRSISPLTTSMNSFSLCGSSNTFAEKLKNSNGINTSAWKKRVVRDEFDDPQPSTGCTFGDALEAALMKAKLEKEGVGRSKQGNKKKKKKQKPISLLSVGMAFNQR